MAILNAASEMASEMGMGAISTVEQLRKFVKKVVGDNLADVQIESASLTSMGEWLGII